MWNSSVLILKKVRCSKSGRRPIWCLLQSLLIKQNGRKPSPPEKRPGNEEGDIYWVNFEPVTAPEFGKIRPGVIVSNSEQNAILPTVAVLPLSSKPPGDLAVAGKGFFARGKAFLCSCPRNKAGRQGAADRDDRVSARKGSGFTRSGACAVFERLMRAGWRHQAFGATSYIPESSVSPPSPDLYPPLQPRGRTSRRRRLPSAGKKVRQSAPHFQADEFQKGQ